MSLYDIALGLGLRPTVRWCAPGENRLKRSRPFYEVELVTRPDENETFVNSVHVWARVRGVEQRRFTGAVYSLNVDGDESYVAEGIGVRCSESRGAAVAQNV